MHAFARAHSAGQHRIRQRAHFVGARSGGVHEFLCVYSEFLSRDFITHRSRNQFSSFVVGQAGDPRVIQRCPTGLIKRLDQRQVIPGIVKLPVRITYSAAQALGLQSGHSSQRFLTRQKCAGKQIALAGHRVIHLHANHVVARAGP